MKDDYRVGKLTDIRSVRPAVYWYCRIMESRLREKDKEKGKDGWHDGKTNYYIRKAMECLFFIAESMRNKKDDIQHIGIAPCSEIKNKNIYILIKKCVDGSNFLMMLADNLRDELIKRGIKP